MADETTEIELTDHNEILFRQVVTAWMREGLPMSVAFKPTPKDKLKLSTDRERATPQTSFERYEKAIGCAPDSTWGIRVGEVLEAHLELAADRQQDSKVVVIDDANLGGNHEDHASLLFPAPDVTSSQLRKTHERLGKELKRKAINHGVQYRP